MTRLRPLLLWCILLIPGGSFAQGTGSPPALPDTPVGRAVGLFVKALNTGSLAELERFHTDRGGHAENAQQDLGFFQQSGGLNLQKVVKASEFEIDVEAIMRKSGRAVVLHLAVDPAPPHEVAGLGVRPSGAQGSGGPRGAAGVEDDDMAPRPAGDVIVAAPAIVDQAVAAGFSGVVLIAKDGKPVLERASGFAHRGLDVKNRIDTKFNLGSINKTFTKLAIAQLMEVGKLGWDDRLGKFLPDFPNADAAAKVTIGHLVEMRSGIGDFFGPEFEATAKNRIRTLSDYLPFFAKKPLAFEPGVGQAYSNGGYLTLGLIIEKVSGQTYYDYVRDHIFKPAGMTDTDSFELDGVTPNLAVGYSGKTRGEWVSNIYSLPARGSSAGGGYSTAPDLVKFAEALVAGRLAGAPYTSWYLGGPRPAPQAPASSSSGPMRGGLGVAGGSPGVNAVFELDAGQRLVIVVLANDGPPAAENLARKIRLGR
ncbi:MAG: beta-lactamase family protein [Vicinamibacteria bacterium]|nr:beta-lactamase family protein [Vicinamibacteria bacterium]